MSLSKILWPGRGVWPGTSGSSTSSSTLSRFRRSLGVLAAGVVPAGGLCSFGFLGLPGRGDEAAVLVELAFRVHGGPHGLELGVLLALGLEDARQGIQELSWIPGLLEDRQSPVVLRQVQLVGVDPGRGDDLHVRVLLPELLNESQPVEAGHGEVGHHHVDIVVVEDAQGRLAVAGIEDAMAARLEDLASEVPLHFVVVHEEDRGHEGTPVARGT